MRKFALKILVKKQPKGIGIYNPFQKLAVGPKQQKISAVGRLPGRPTNGPISDRCAIGQPTGRPRLDPESSAIWPVDCPVDRDQIQRTLCSLDGRPYRSTDPQAKWPVHICAHRSTGPVDRLLSRSTVRSTGRRPGQTISEIKTWFFKFQLNPIKSHKFHKNKFF